MFEIELGLLLVAAVDPVLRGPGEQGVMLSAEVRAEDEVEEDGPGEFKDVRRIGREGEERFGSQDASVLMQALLECLQTND
ncbi:hypothetical protein V494_00020 [Pseudogymnoascus sp. VKM F-4513 (FW-928)]|nr:hypothetical protein V494_00020 [Pseudogymnoascus sp. VKM F-4513 (FW-928)]